MESKEITILNHIHKTADMGKESLLHICDLAKNPEFKDALEEQIDGYKATYYISEEMLKERDAEKTEDAGGTSVIMSKIMTDLNYAKDPSSSELADMVIKGSVNGITKLTKLINSYDGQDNDVLSFAIQEIENERDNIEAMKKFL